MKTKVRVPGLTDDESDQWNQYGCGSRCLLKLRELAQAPMTVKDYVTQFKDYFDPGKLGIIDVSEIVRIAHDLVLSNKVYAFRNREVVHRESARREGGKKVHRATLLLTDRDKDDAGVWGEYHHCRLLRGVLPTGEWVFWHPNADGIDFEVKFSEAELDERFAHFLALH
jgi:hypothetical protein